MISGHTPEFSELDNQWSWFKTTHCTNKIGGTVIGTSGSYLNHGNTGAKVFDGSLTTFFDAPDNSGDWVGLDFGAGVSNMISQINYWPRIGWASRMFGGVFQGDNTTPTFSNPVTLFTITVVPPDNGTVTAQPIPNLTAFRCVRYAGPASSACNVAELQFFSSNPPPLPIFLTNSWNGGRQNNFRQSRPPRAAAIRLRTVAPPLPEMPPVRLAELRFKPVSLAILVASLSRQNSRNSTRNCFAEMRERRKYRFRIVTLA